MSDGTIRGEPVMIPPARIIPDPDFQPRETGLSESHVRLLMESDPATWPPLTVAPDGAGFVLIDGFHRREAAHRLGIAALPCVVVPGAGYPEAVAANLRHGLPLAMADRKEAARWYADQEPGLSFREIGRRVSLSDKTVKRAIESPSAECAEARSAPDPLDHWFTQTYNLDRTPSARDVRRDIDAYDEAERPEVARVYAETGEALIEASTLYLSGEHRPKGLFPR